MTKEQESKLREYFSEEQLNQFDEDKIDALYHTIDQHIKYFSAEQLAGFNPDKLFELGCCVEWCIEKGYTEAALKQLNWERFADEAAFVPRDFDSFLSLAGPDAMGALDVPVAGDTA